MQTLRLEAGTTYYIQGGDRYAVWGFTNTFSVSLSVVPPPPNDNFSDAISFNVGPVLGQPRSDSGERGAG